MTMPNLIDLISKSAPMLGTALGGPIGGIIGGAASVFVPLIAHVFGADPKNLDDIFEKVILDPEATIKLKQLELQHQELLAQINVQNYAKEVDDRSNARKFNVDLISSTQQPMMLWFLTIMIFVVGFGCLYGMFTCAEIKSELAMVLTACIYEFKNIYKLFTGDTIDDSQQTNTKKS